MNNKRNNFDMSYLDKRVDQFFEVSRQVVDGVSGKRPGKRSMKNSQDFSRRSLKNVGRWVNEKVDSFFDYDNEDDFEIQAKDYDEMTANCEKMDKSINTENQISQNLSSRSKRPLKAISLRELSHNQLQEQKKLPSRSSLDLDNWPQDSEFKASRWQRDVAQPLEEENIKTGNNSELKTRNFPKSRRRRT